MSGAKVIQYNYAKEQESYRWRTHNEWKELGAVPPDNIPQTAVPRIGCRWVYYSLEGGMAVTTYTPVVSFDIDSGVVITETEVLIRG